MSVYKCRLIVLLQWSCIYQIEYMMVYVHVCDKTPIPISVFKKIALRYEVNVFLFKKNQTNNKTKLKGKATSCCEIRLILNSTGRPTVLAYLTGP